MHIRGTCFEQNVIVGDQLIVTEIKPNI